MVKKKIKVYGMTCTSCQNKVETALKKLKGVKNASASFKEQSATIEFDQNLCTYKDIIGAIKKSGYSTKDSSKLKIVGMLIIAAAVILLSTSTSTGFDINSKLNGASYFMLFIVGLLTSIHCVGMCGGIMLSQSSHVETSSKMDSIKPAIFYNLGRVISYTLLGGIVGTLGSVLSLSIGVKAALQIAAGLFMIVMGLNMAGFSIFRRFNIKLPWSSCSLKKKPKTPFLIGILNGLMPCGPLQTMQLYALGTGSPIKGALSMFLFSLGTVPLMLGFGAISGILSKGYTKNILKFSGILVVILGILMGNRGLNLYGISFSPTATAALSKTYGNSSSNSQAKSNINKPTIENGVQVIKMDAVSSGYSQNVFYVQKNMPVKWIISGNELTSCNYQLVIPSLNIQKELVSGDNVISFTPKDGDINFTCGMGMLNGVIKVVDNINSQDASKDSEEIPPATSPGCCAGKVPSN